MYIPAYNTAGDSGVVASMIRLPENIPHWMQCIHWQWHCSAEESAARGGEEAVVRHGLQLIKIADTLLSTAELGQ
jgi:hypothetical protein